MASPWDEVRELLRAATAGEFEVLGELGRGGMAAVYLAHDISLNRKIAIKVMAPGLLLGAGMVERFKQEAVTVANLNHPHIVTIHGVRQAAGLHYFLLRLIPGASLERIIREVRPLPIPVIQALAYQVGSALSYAHRRGVIHRDIKPSNILLDDEGNGVVTDFGIAKVIESPSHTQTGTTVGTPAYMSPEQCWSREVTAASDQYSLGIVLYEMLAGKPPFSGPTLGILRAHTEDEPRPIHEARPECPPALAEAVHKMLEKEPARRWPTVLRAVEALGGHQVRDDHPVREDLLRLSRLGPDHPLPGVPTPRSPVPARLPSRPPPAEESIQVRMRPPTPVPAPPVQPRPPGASEPRVSAPGPAAWVRRGYEAAKPYWWAAPALLLLVLAWGLWGSAPGSTDPVDTRADTVATTGRPLIPVAAVELAGVPTRVVAGDRFTLAVTARGPRGDALPGRDVAWSSSPPGVAEVSPEGEVTALAAGRATITARVEPRAPRWCSLSARRAPRRHRSPRPPSACGWETRPGCGRGCWTSRGRTSTEW
ncbi:MAG TPA: protein kinase [Gemmatimonadales bacterium]|nr:protein kinase [Gemmatimonadales bacterium]